MTNSPIGMTCPKCGHAESFMICANVWGMHTENGFDDQHASLPNCDSDWDQYRPCVCPACKEAGVVEDFLA